MASRTSGCVERASACRRDRQDSRRCHVRDHGASRRRQRRRTKKTTSRPRYPLDALNPLLSLLPFGALLPFRTLRPDLSLRPLRARWTLWAFHTGSFSTNDHVSLALEELPVLYVLSLENVVSATQTPGSSSHYWSFFCFALASFLTWASCAFFSLVTATLAAVSSRRI